MESNQPSGKRQHAIARAERFSPFLREALRARPDIAEYFELNGAEKAADLAVKATDAELGIELRRQRLGLALAVALGDLAGELSLEDVTGLLSGFADRAIHRAVEAAIHERVPDADVHGFAVIAMGKLGSRELNYSSDVDLLLLFDPDTLPRRARDDAGEAAVRIGRRLIELLQKRTADGYVARVDLRLRPSPEVTPIALPINAAISHYESSALPWERAAFIRAEACAGDIVLGQRFLSAIEPFVWRRSLDFGVIDEVRQISARIRDHFAQSARFGPGFDLKRGRGGIREVEFFVQIEQMVHGGRDPSVRPRATLDAIAALVAAGRLDEAAAGELAQTYRLLRTIEHRVQMVDDAQTHILPAQTEALDNVALLHGLESGAALLELLEPRVERAGQMFDALAPEQNGQLSNDPDILLDELKGFGFPDPSAAAGAIPADLGKIIGAAPYDVALDKVRRLVNERRFALGVQLIDRRSDPLEVAAGYARVAEGTVDALAKAAVWEFEDLHGRFPGGELVIVALGRLGGRELTHASDLDIIYLHTAQPGAMSDGAKPLGPNDYFNRLASRVTAALSVPTAAGPLYDVDTRLRPEGAKGMLVVSLDAFERYQREEAWTWEHMALCRARAMFGSAEVRDRTTALIEDILNARRDPKKVVSDAVKMRAEIAQHKPPQSNLDVKLGPGGLVDLEFAVHVLQLTRGVGFNPQLEFAIAELQIDGLVSSKIVAAPKLLTRMLVMMRLVAPGDVKPTADTWQLVADACGAASWDELLAEHDVARQSVPDLWTRIKQEA